MVQKVKSKLRNYHHGNLRHELVVEARRLLEVKGPVELSLRAVARHVGVSEAAPARHFNGKDDLLQAIATQGFNELIETRRDIIRSGLGKLELAYKMMRSYVEFALNNRGVFNLMVGPRLWVGGDHGDLKAAGSESFGLFYESVVDLALEKGWPADSIEYVAHTAWSVEHGLASLVLANRAPRSGVGIQFEDMVDFSLAMLMSAIANGPENFEKVLDVTKARGQITCFD